MWVCEWMVIGKWQECSSSALVLYLSAAHLTLIESVCRWTKHPHGPLLTLCFTLTTLWAGFSLHSRPLIPSFPPSLRKHRNTGMCPPPPSASPGNCQTTAEHFSCQTSLVFPLAFQPSLQRFHLSLLGSPLPYKRKSLFCLILRCLQISEMNVLPIAIVFLR